MFDINNNGVKQKIHLGFNAFFSKVLRDLCKILQYNIVVCGFPRSGTSLLYNMLSVTLPGFRFGSFEKYFIYNIHKLGNLATKAPLDVLHLPRIDHLNVNRKNLVILIMVRDIRDIITSRHPIYPDDYFIGYDHSWWPQNSRFTEWSYNAPGVVEIHHAIKEAVKRQDALLIRYEDLVPNPDAIQADIEKKFNLMFNGAFSEFHKNPANHAYRYEGKYAAKVPELVLENKSSSTDRICRWKRSNEARARVKRQFSECPELFSILEAYGYEDSRTWFNLI